MALCSAYEYLVKVYDERIAKNNRVKRFSWYECIDLGNMAKKFTFFGGLERVREWNIATYTYVFESPVS